MKGVILYLTFCFFAAVVLFSCDSSSPFQGNKQFSFSENFDGNVNDIKGRWFWPYIPGNGCIGFRLDSSECFSPERSMGSGSPKGYGMHYAGYTGTVFTGAILILNDTLHLTDSNSYLLEFYDKRNITTIQNLPSPLAGQENDPNCYVEISTDMKTWKTLLRFPVSKPNWSKESISLKGYTGKNVFIRFTVCQHATRHASTYWHVDDISVFSDSNVR